MNTFNTFYISLPLCKVLQPVSKQRAKWLPSDMWSLQLYSNTPVTVFLLWLALKQKPHTVKNNNSLIFFCLLPNYQVRISNLAQYCPHPWHSKISLTRLHPWERSWAASRVEHNRKAVPAFVTQSSRMFRLLTNVQAAMSALFQSSLISFLFLPLKWWQYDCEMAELCMSVWDLTVWSSVTSGWENFTVWKLRGTIYNARCVVNNQLKIFKMQETVWSSKWCRGSWVLQPSCLHLRWFLFTFELTSWTWL